MLTITAPIELKTASLTLGDNGFAERIRDNYAVIGSRVSEESLTHMLHTPPQLLIAEGGESNTLISSSLTSVTQLQQTLISNVMNRILLSNEMTLSYQDRIYITSMLHKLGIRDERRFMNESRRILSETRNSTELTRFYLESMPVLQQMMLTYQERREQEKGQEEEAQSPEPENRLYLSIMQRLQTGAIYQIVQNMTRNMAGDNLSLTEVALSEQSYTARQLLLTQFREMASGTDVPMIYRSENIFEEETREAAEGGEERIRERINSAILLELIRSFDHAQSLRIERESKQWTDLRENFYRSADQCLSRILIEAREGRSPVHYEENRLQFVTQTEEQEIQVLQELMQDQEWEPVYAEEPPLSFRETVMTDRHTESMEEMLERVNEQNKQNVERYLEIRRILSERSEGERRISDRERTIRESLRSLNNREHLMELLEKEDVSQPSAMERTMEKVYALLPPETVEILRQTNGEAPSIPVERGEAEIADALSSAGEQEAELTERFVPAEQEYLPETELDEYTTEILRSYERLITRDFRERERAVEERERVERTVLEPAETLLLLQKLSQTNMEELEPALMSVHQDRRSTVIRMIHRSLEQLTEEDVLQTLEEYRKNEKRETVVKEEQGTVTELFRQEPARVVETVQPADTRRQSEEIARMVEEGMRRQLGFISNEVYNRLERRLQTERARRGI